ncbi:UNVERIFIED_CONTAM: hypothetical protein FKN15_013551 [Acipenser sinensis]
MTAKLNTFGICLLVRPLVLHSLGTSVFRHPRCLEDSPPWRFDTCGMSPGIRYPLRVFRYISATQLDASVLRPRRCSRAKHPDCNVYFPPMHVMQAYAAEVQVTHLANTGSLLTAYLDSMLRVVTLPKPLALELCALSGTLLQISGFQGQALGRSLTGLVVVRRQLWLTQARVPDVDHILVHITRCAFLPWPYIWTSGRGDIATLSQKAREILAGSCDAPLPCLGMGKGEALVSGSYQSNLDYPGPDGTTKRPEAPPPGLCGKEPAARTLLAQLHLRLLGASTVHTGYALQFHSGPPPFLRDYGHIRKRPFPVAQKDFKLFFFLCYNTNMDVAKLQGLIWPQTEANKMNKMTSLMPSHLEEGQ